MNQNFFQCRHGGCRNHGSCLDQQTMQELFEKTKYEKEFVEHHHIPHQTKNSIDFEKEILRLEELLQQNNFEQYNTELNRIANFIMHNCEANKPSTLRHALQLATSTSFAAWADETAKTELEFCNTNLLKQL